MDLYLVSKRSGINAKASFDKSKKEFVVLKDSVVSQKVSKSTTFKASKNIEELRQEFVKNNKVVKDVMFKSPSTAANFVTGSSTNGLRAWKNSDGKKLKELV